MTWGSYWMFFNCPKCGKKYRWALEELPDPLFGKCPDCRIDGKLVAETKDLDHGKDDDFADYEYA